MRKLWLHIGAPKSGTTSLQHFANAQSARLGAGGVTYIAPGQRSSSNVLAVAITNHRRDDITRMSANLARKIAKAPGDILMSSEQFFGIAPSDVLGALPDITEFELQVLCYLRRQDSYIESLYLQKRKRGMFPHSIAEFITHFDGSGSDYTKVIAPWEDAGATPHIRICERARLVGGSVVTDALHVLGLPQQSGDEIAGGEVNTSPSLRRLQLIDAAKAAGFPNIRRLQRNLPPDPAPKARFLAPEDRRAFLDRYAACNEQLRKRYHPDQTHLFSTDGLDDPIDDQPLWSEPDLAEITALLEGLRKIDS